MSQEDFLGGNGRPNSSHERSDHGRPHSRGRTKERTKTDSSSRSSSLDLAHSREADAKNPSSPSFSYLNNPQTYFGSEVPHTIRTDDTRPYVPSRIKTSRGTSNSILDTIAKPYKYFKRCVGNKSPQTSSVDISSPEQVNGTREVGTVVQSISLILNGQYDPDERIPSVSNSRVCDEVTKQYPYGRKEQMNDDQSVHSMSPLLVNLLYPQIKANERVKFENPNTTGMTEKEMSENATNPNIETKGKSKRVSIFATDNEPSEDGSFGHPSCHLTTSSKCTNLFEAISKHVMSIASPGKSFDSNDNSATRFPRQNSFMFSESLLLRGRKASENSEGVDSENEFQPYNETLSSYEQINFGEDAGLRPSPSSYHSRIGANDRKHKNVTSHQDRGVSYPAGNMPVGSVRDMKDNFGLGQKTKRPSVLELIAKMYIHDLLVEKYAAEQEAHSSIRNKRSNPSTNNVPGRAAITPSIEEIISSISLHKLLEDKYVIEKQKDPSSRKNKIDHTLKNNSSEENTQSQDVIELRAEDSEEETMHKLLDDQYLERPPGKSRPAVNEISEDSTRENQLYDKTDECQNADSPSGMELQSLPSKQGLLVQQCFIGRDAQSSPYNISKLSRSDCDTENKINNNESTPTIVLYRESPFISTSIGRIKDEDMIRSANENEHKGTREHEDDSLGVDNSEENEIEIGKSTEYLLDVDNTDNFMKMQSSNENVLTDEPSLNNLNDGLVPCDEYESLPGFMVNGGSSSSLEDCTRGSGSHLMCDSRKSLRDIHSRSNAESLPKPDSETHWNEMQVVRYQSPSVRIDSGPNNNSSSEEEYTNVRTESQLAFPVSPTNWSNQGISSEPIPTTPENLEASVGSIPQGLIDESVSHFPTSEIISSSNSSIIPTLPPRPRAPSLSVDSKKSTLSVDSIESPSQQLRLSDSNSSSNLSSKPRRPRSVSQSYRARIDTVPKSLFEATVSQFQHPRSTSRSNSSKMSPESHCSTSESTEASNLIDEQKPPLTFPSSDSRRQALSCWSITQGTDPSDGRAIEDSVKGSGPLSDILQVRFESSSALLNWRSTPLELPTSANMKSSEETLPQVTRLQCPKSSYGSNSCATALSPSFKPESKKAYNGSMSEDLIDDSVALYPHIDFVLRSNTSSIPPVQYQPRSIPPSIQSREETKPRYSIHDTMPGLQHPHSTSRSTANRQSMQHQNQLSTAESNQEMVGAIPVNWVDESTDDFMSQLEQPRSISRSNSSRMSPCSTLESREAGMGSTMAQDPVDESSSLLQFPKSNSKRAPVHRRPVTKSSEQSVDRMREDSIGESGPLSDCIGIRFDSSSALLNWRGTPLTRLTSEHAETPEKTAPRDMVESESAFWSLIRFLSTSFYKKLSVDGKLTEVNGRSKASLNEVNPANYDNLDVGTKSSGADNIPKVQEILSIYSRGRDDKKRNVLLLENNDNRLLPVNKESKSVVRKKGKDKNIDLKQDTTEFPWQGTNSLATPIAVTPANVQVNSSLASSSQDIEDLENTAQVVILSYVSEEDDEEKSADRQEHNSRKTRNKHEKDHDEPGRNKKRKNSTESNEDNVVKQKRGIFRRKSKKIK